MKTKFLFILFFFFLNYLATGQAMDFAKSLETNPLWDLPTKAIQMEVDSNGNIIVLGGFNGVIDVDPTANQLLLTTDVGTDFHQTNMFLAKYSPQGDLIWGFEIGNTGRVNGTSMVIDSYNNIVVVGLLNALGVDFDPGPNEYLWGGSNDLFVVKYTTNGDFVWFNKIESTNGTSSTKTASIINWNSGFTNDYVVGVDFDGDIGLFIGSTQNNYQSNGRDFLIANLSSNGIWTQATQYGGGFNEYLLDIYQNSASKLVFSWYDTGHVGGEERTTYLTKREPNGTTNNILRLSGNADLVDFEEDSSNNLYLFGHFSGGITDVDDNTLILPNIHNSSQGFIIKLDASEQYDWIKHIEAYGDGIQFPGFAASDMQIKDDNVLIAAGIKGKFDILNLNNQTMFVENPNNWINSLFVKYSPSGNVLWKFIYEGQSANKVVSIKSFNNYFYTFGLFKDQTDFNSHPWFPFYMNSTNNSSDFFFAKYNDIFILNPSLGNTNYGLDKNSLVTVEKGNNNFDLWMLGSQDEIFLFKVYDLSGRLITVGSFLKLNDDFYSSLDMSGMSAGVYIVKVNGLGLTHLPLTARIIVK